MSSRIEAPLPPVDEKQAKHWVEWAIIELGEGFHPDTPGDNYISFKTRKPIFVGKSRERFDAGLQAAHDLLDDIYQTTIEIADTGDMT